MSGRVRLPEAPSPLLDGMQVEHPGLARFAWAVLAYNVGVILWGAYVRATGSGAGCGKHWPLCNGEMIPQAVQTQTMIEFTHRITSGIALLLVILLWVLCRRWYPKRHLARYGALAALILILNEAVLGASLVLFEHVAQDKSVARAVSLSLHFVNTLLLLAAITLTAQWLSRQAQADIRRARSRLALFGVGLLGIILTGASGAIAALGDTLFRATSLASSLTQDFSSTSHFLLRLRVLHPAIAIIVAAYFVWLLAPGVRNKSYRVWAIAAISLMLLQLGLGFLNVVLLAPVWLQLIHLLVADTVWIVLTLLAWRSLEQTNFRRTGKNAAAAT